MEEISFIEAVVGFVCVLGVFVLMYRLFSGDRCPYGGTHDWEVYKEYQMVTLHKCKKCGEIKSEDKLN